MDPVAIIGGLIAAGWVIKKVRDKSRSGHADGGSGWSASDGRGLFGGSGSSSSLGGGSGTDGAVSSGDHGCGGHGHGGGDCGGHGGGGGHGGW
jgi:hypothetical protein